MKTPPTIVLILFAVFALGTRREVQAECFGSITDLTPMYIPTDANGDRVVSFPNISSVLVNFNDHCP